MASPSNPNQAGHYDGLNKFFKPPSPISANPGNPTSLPYPLPPSSSYPPPTSGGPFSYAPQTSPYHQYHHLPFATVPDHHLSNLHQQRSVSFPTPPLQSPPHALSQNPTPNPNPGARLMALLSGPSSSKLEIPQQQPAVPLSSLPQSSSVEFMVPSSNVPVLPPMIPSSHVVNPAVMGLQTPMRMPSSKLPPKGRHLIGEHVVYDIDSRLQGEVQPQLEVTPITKYVSDPQLVVGHQIAVSKTYICYGLKLGNVRILNINTALRSLLRGHTQRVTDMAFFAEDVPLFASVSIDGRVYVWKISEGPDDEDKPQISGNIVIALQIIGDEDPKHPRVCWHCHKQEVLVVAIGKRVLRIDTTKAGKSEVFSAEEPLKCPSGLIDGVQLVGKHDGEVTDLSMCQWMTTRLVSASMDGTIKIWEDRKAQPLLVLRPHDGQPVYSATFMTAPHHPDHIILISAGPLNRELKIWMSDGEEGWLLPSDSESWHCSQTLVLKSSSEPCVEEAFFNQIVALPQSGLLLLANAKKNAIYAVHLEYGPNPATTCIDYIAEFMVTMPILSFTGTSDIFPHGNHIVQVYCVQTQAIQQYALDLSQCLPPPLENDTLDSNAFHDATSTETATSFEPSVSNYSEVIIPSTASKPPPSPESVTESSQPMRWTTFHEYGTSNTEPKPVSLPLPVCDTNTTYDGSPHPLSPRLSGKLSGLHSPKNVFETGTNQSVDRQVDTVHTNFPLVASVTNDSKNDDDVSIGHNPPVMFKLPTHLVTPSDFKAVSSTESTHEIESRSENTQDVVFNNDMGTAEVEVKVVDETKSNQNDEHGSREESQKNLVSDDNEKSFCSQTSDIGLEMALESFALSDSCSVGENLQINGACETETSARSSNVDEESILENTKGISGKDADSKTHQPLPTTKKGKKQKGKNSQVSDPPSPNNSFNQTDSSNEAGVSLSVPTIETVFPQIISMQDTLNQLMTMQKEFQKQMAVMISVPVTKEGRRLESAIGRNMEKCLNGNSDALWSRVHEENAKTEKLIRDQSHHTLGAITNLMTKDKELPAILEKMVKREISAMGPTIARTISTSLEKTVISSLEKTVASVIFDTLQRGLSDKAVNQLDKSVNSKLETTVTRQIQAQFQTTGKQALHDSLRSSLESSLVPAFEKSCKAMFEQVDAAFKKGMSEHAAAAQQQFETAHSPLAITLREAINSASSMTQTLSGELADGQQKILAFAVAEANSKTINPLVTQQSNGVLSNFHEKVEASVDPTKELSRLVAERKFEEAFTIALQRSDVFIVSWLCSQVDLQGILSITPFPLSQGVLLSLLQQLGCDMSNDRSKKLGWMMDVAVAINPSDPMISMHVRPVFEQVHQILTHHLTLPTTTRAESTNIRLLMHVINSLLVSSTAAK